VKTIELTADPYVWADIPLAFPCGPFEVQADWASALGEAYSEGKADASAVRDRLTEIARALPVEPRLGLIKLLWLAPDPDKQPLLVNVNLMSQVGLESIPLQELAGAYEPDPVRPPVVDRLDSPAFGSIARVLSYVRSAERGNLVMQISLVGKRDGLLVRLDAFTSDLAYGVLAVDPITELMNTITLVEIEDEPESSAAE